jgi:hypothetical protein
MARAALALYPPAWRSRYGDEVHALLDESGGGVRAIASVAWHALPAWIRPAGPRLDALRILAAYGTVVDAAQLAVCQQLRRLNLTIWYDLYAERLPELRPRSAELLAAWPAS